jgi:uncharacterized protein YndB with AHSA1/START domain
VTDVQKDFDALTMTMTAEFDAPVDRVWQLWADPRQLERWWCPPDHPATFHEHDLSPGGRVAYYMTTPDGEKMNGWWKVVEVEEPKRLRIEDGLDDDGNFNEEMKGPGGMVVTFSEADGRTTMILEFFHGSREDLEQMIENGFEQGMQEAIAQIDPILAG